MIERTPHIRDLEIVILSEVSDGEILYDIPYMWSPKRDDTNELTKQKETHRLREQTCGCYGEGWGGRD